MEFLGLRPLFFGGRVWPSPPGPTPVGAAESAEGEREKMGQESASGGGKEAWRRGWPVMGVEMDDTERVDAFRRFKFGWPSGKFEVLRFLGR